ncbi:MULTISPECIES: response regulator [unclassified Caulobacter]|uniref:response regulator n=1 Tax=unclassified Caulobacter TaxID=2648921 RepID=UPI0013047D03|nr:MULTISPECIES: response regulator [unclassified Caulobacter]
MPRSASRPHPVTWVDDVSVSLTDRIARLERRLARAEKARHEAETIAERETLNLFRQKEQMRLLSELAIMANRGGDLVEVLRTALASICSFTGWPIGHVQLVEPLGDGRRRMRPSGIWWASDTFDGAALIAATEAIEFVDGVGLPGVVLSQARAYWISVEDNGTLPRSRIAPENGIAAGVALPVLVGSEVAAILEFGQAIALDPGEDTLDLLNRIGAILGRAIERDRASLAAAAAQRDLEQMLHRAEAASRAKTQLMAVASHEVRTPLNAVLGLSEALSNTPLTAEQRDQLDGIRRSGGMLLRLLNAVLDFVQVESVGLVVSRTDFDLVRLATDVSELWTAPAAAAGLALHLDHSALGDAYGINGDSGKIEQTLTSLIANAVRCTPAGGAIHVRLGAPAGPDDLVLCEVCDSGGGLPVAERAWLIAPSRTSAMDEATEGAGLNLAISAANIRALGGDIGCDTGPDGSCRFWFAFPAPAAQTTAVAPQGSAEPDLSLRILAAEDNLGNQRVLQLFLAQFGQEALMVEDGVAAVEAFGRQSFDLILMDANMPHMDGVSAVEAIRRLEGQGRRTPIFMLTANVFDDDVARYEAAGVDGVLSKPIIVSELYAVLAAVQDTL